MKEIVLPNGQKITEEEVEEAYKHSLESNDRKKGRFKVIKRNLIGIGIIASLLTGFGRGEPTPKYEDKKTEDIVEITNEEPVVIGEEQTINAGKYYESSLNHGSGKTGSFQEDTQYNISGLSAVAEDGTYVNTSFTPGMSIDEFKEQTAEKYDGNVEIMAHVGDEKQAYGWIPEENIEKKVTVEEQTITHTEKVQVGEEPGPITYDPVKGIGTAAAVGAVVGAASYIGNKISGEEETEKEEEQIVEPIPPINEAPNKASTEFEKAQENFKKESKFARALRLAHLDEKDPTQTVGGYKFHA